MLSVSLFACCFNFSSISQDVNQIDFWQPDSSEPGKVKSPVGQYKISDKITAKVINISPKDRKIGLSFKKLEEQDERSNYDDYLNSAKAATSNLGELLKEELEAKAGNTPSDK